MCTRYPIINRVSELKVHIELTRFVQPEKIEIDANERAVNEKSQYCFFVCTTFDSFLNDLFAISQAYMSKLFRKYTKESYNQYLTGIRMERAKQLMEANREFFVKDIAEMVGYRDQFYFSRIFRAYTGKSPAEYLK